MHTIGKPIAAKGAVNYFKEDFAEKINSALDLRKVFGRSADEEDVFSSEDADEGDDKSSGSSSPKVIVENNKNAFRATQTMSRWRGKLAEKFGLEGSVTKKDFALLCEGIHPETGEQLIRHVKPRTKTRANGKTFQTISHRAGLDQSINAPKSVSLVATKDERVIEAHFNSAVKTIDEIEKFTRAKMGNTKPSELTGESLYAVFLHDMARPDEKTGFAAPDLHSHHFQINVVFDEQGKPHALEMREVYACQTLATAVYRAEIVKAMKNLGYEMEINERTSAPEVVGISRDYIDASSPRQKQIKETASELGIKSTKTVASGYRKGKNFNREEMLRRHQEMEERFGNQAEAAAGKARKRTVQLKLDEIVITPQERKAAIKVNAQKAGAAAELAITKARENKDAEKLKDRKVTWQTLMTDTINFSRLEITIDEVKTELVKRHKNGELDEFNLDRREMKNKRIQENSAKERGNEEKYDEQRTLGSENQGIAREGQTSRGKSAEESDSPVGKPFAGSKVGQNSSVGDDKVRASPIDGIVKTESANQFSNDAGNGGAAAQFSGTERSIGGYSTVVYIETERAEFGGEQLAGGRKQFIDTAQPDSEFIASSAGEHSPIESPENGHFEFAGSNNSADRQFSSVGIAEEFNQNRIGTINTTSGAGNGGYSGFETKDGKFAEPNELDKAARIHEIRASEDGKSGSLIVDWRAEAEPKHLVRTVESNFDSGNQAADSTTDSAPDSGRSKSADDSYESGNAGSKDRGGLRQSSQAAQSFDRAAEAPVAEKVGRAEQQAGGGEDAARPEENANFDGAAISSTKEERKLYRHQPLAAESDAGAAQSSFLGVSRRFSKGELPNAELPDGNRTNIDGNLQSLPNGNAIERKDERGFSSDEQFGRIQNSFTKSIRTGEPAKLFSADADLVAGNQSDAGDGAQKGNSERDIIIWAEPSVESNTASQYAKQSVNDYSNDGDVGSNHINIGSGDNELSGLAELITESSAVSDFNNNSDGGSELDNRTLLPAKEMELSFPFEADRFVPQILQTELGERDAVFIQPVDIDNQSALELLASGGNLGGAGQSVDCQPSGGIDSAEIIAQFSIKPLDSETKQNLYELYSSALDVGLSEIEKSIQDNNRTQSTAVISATIDQEQNNTDMNPDMIDEIREEMGLDAPVMSL